MKKLKIILQFKYLYLIFLLISLIYSSIILKFDIYKTYISKNTSTFTGKIIKIQYKYDYNILIIKNKEKVLVYDYRMNIDYKLGDNVVIYGNFSIPANNTNFYLLNYNHYLKSQKIYYKVNADSITLEKKNKSIFYIIKNKIIKRVNKINNSYINAFILGDSSYISKNIKNSYKDNGINHLFAISGMHVSIIILIISSVLNKSKNNIFHHILICSFLMFYMFLTDFSPSVNRASILYFLLLIKKYGQLNICNFNLLLFLLSINLIVNPFILYNSGFLFSYIISLFIIKFSDIINNYKNYFIKTLITSFIAFLSTIPILINSNFSINLLTPFINIIFIPLISFIIFPASIITFIFPPFNKIFLVFINLLELMSLNIQKIKIATLILCHINIFVVFIYYIIIIILLYSIKKRQYYKILILILLIIIHKCYPLLMTNSIYTVLEVNQGDSNLIIFPHNKGNILIDTGGIYNKNLTENILIPTLKSYGISYLDYLIITHGDYDHMGEAINLVNNFKVEKVIFNCGPHNDLESELIKVLDKKKIKYYSCIKELNIDKNKLYFLQTKEYDNENDNSNVIYTEFDGYKFMFMGDSSTTTEKEIMDKYKLPDIDVLKVGHHGSKTSSGKEFVDEINPKYSVISVGKNNRYGHPNKEVLSNLEDSKIYRTDKDGSIMFKIKNNKLEIETCSP